MSDFIKMTCPSCGGNLEITQDIDRFACAHCGVEHIVKRAGGIVSLSPVVEGIKQVQVGTDKTAAELALKRLEKEIPELENMLLKIKEEIELKRGENSFYNRVMVPLSMGLLPGVLFGGMSFSCFSENFSGNINELLASFLGFMVFIVMSIPIVLVLMRRKKKLTKKNEMEIESLQDKMGTAEKSLLQKKREQEHNRAIVSLG